MSALDISLTTFIDFAAKSGTRRITCVREARALYDQDYHPARDFWRGLRQAIIALHQGDGARADLDALLLRVPSRKSERYEQSIAGYKRFLGRHELSWFEPPHTRWDSGNLSVRVNPELGLLIDGEPHLVKLYMKQASIAKFEMDAMLYLLRQSTPPHLDGATPLVVDVARGKSFRPTREISELGALLDGEAAAFVAMWREFDAAA